MNPILNVLCEEGLDAFEWGSSKDSLLKTKALDSCKPGNQAIHGQVTMFYNLVMKIQLYLYNISSSFLPCAGHGKHTS